MKSRNKSTPLALVASVAVAIASAAIAQQPLGPAIAETIEGDAMKQRAAQLGFPLRVQHDGGLAELIRFVDGHPQYYTTTNANAANTLRTNLVHSSSNTGFYLDGFEVSIGVWDGGAGIPTHVAFNGRVTIADGAGISDHATHVTGTLIANANDPGAKGMAPVATAVSYDWNSDSIEMNAASFELSNHSYAVLAGWSHTTEPNGYGAGPGWYWFGDPVVSSTESPYFGIYDAVASSWDSIAYNKPDYLIVKAAGNDRGEGPAAGTTHFHLMQNGSWVQATDTHATDGQYDCIPTFGNAKNILTVGAIDDLAGGGNGCSPELPIASFSGWGPADDGRIKPDIVANGVSLYSPMAIFGGGVYGTMSGTSMASPNACGSAALLLQHWRDVDPRGPNQQDPRSATLKGLIIHTARQPGSDPDCMNGPNYRTGWGLMDTQAAAVALKYDYYSRGGSANFDTDLDAIREETLVEGEVLEFPITGVRAGDRVRVTICWTDPAHAGLLYFLDPPTPMLVNDLDLRVIEVESGFMYRPYVLDRLNPANSAATADNSVDNVEVVEFEAAVAGVYRIEVSHKASLSGEVQDFSLFVNGVYRRIYSVPHQAQPNLGAALSAAAANPGADAITLLFGNYPGAVTINQPVTLFASGDGSATIGQ